MEKNVLLIMPEFYNYQEMISSHIEGAGFKCYVFAEEPKRLIFLCLKNIKVILKRQDVYKKFRRNLLRQICALNCTFDYVVVIRGNILNGDFLQALKRSIAKEAKWIYYTWDSLKYLEHKGEISIYFDQCYSFDSVDVQDNKAFELLPLFFDDTYSSLRTNPVYEYDYCSVAGFSKERYECAKKIIRNNPESNLFIRFYLSRNLYWIKMIKDREYFSKIDMELIVFTPFSSEEIKKIYDKSKAIIDITHSGQHGLTMRIIESLGMRKKVVTNNTVIKEYDFYNSDDFYVVDDGWQLPSPEWLSKEYAVDDVIRKKYSIESWVRKLMGA